MHGTTVNGQRCAINTTPPKRADQRPTCAEIEDRGDGGMKTHQWTKCSDQMPMEGVVVLTIRQSDLYPITAFYLGESWWAQHEGPEDMNEDLIRELLYSPTHWMPTPENPEL